MATLTNVSQDFIISRENGSKGVEHVSEIIMYLPETADMNDYSSIYQFSWLFGIQDEKRVPSMVGFAEILLNEAQI